MSLPATRLALPNVGTTGSQGPDPAARAYAKVRGLFRCGQLEQRPVRSHDVHNLQRGNFPELSQATAAPTNTGPAHDPRTRQCSLSSRSAPGSIPASKRPTPAAAIPATLQPSTCPDRARLETDPAPGNAQSLLRNASRGADSRQRLLRSLAQTERRLASSMLHYLRRCV